MHIHFQSFSKNLEHNHKDGEEEADEVLSLCDLPLQEEEITTSLDQGQGQSTQSSSSSSSTGTLLQDQFFEFIMIDQGFEMSSAEDIFSGGMLIAFTTPPPVKFLSTGDEKQGRLLHRRSGSLSELESDATRYESVKDCKPLRASRSLDDQKLSRFHDPKTSSSGLDFEKSAASIKSVGKYDNKKKTGTANKPKRYYFPMIGITRFPPAMDVMRGIKSRQVRRSSSDAVGDSPANRSTRKGAASSSSSSSSWRFIKALSCNDHASVAVTSSLCVSHA